MYLRSFPIVIICNCIDSQVSFKTVQQAASARDVAPSCMAPPPPAWTWLTLHHLPRWPGAASNLFNLARHIHIDDSLPHDTLPSSFSRGFPYCLQIKPDVAR